MIFTNSKNNNKDNGNGLKNAHSGRRPHQKYKLELCADNKEVECEIFP